MPIRSSRETLTRATRTTPLCGQGTAGIAVGFLESSVLPRNDSGDGGRGGRARRIRSPGSPQGLLNLLPVTCENGYKFRRHGVMGGRTLRMYNMNKGHFLNALPPSPPLHFGPYSRDLGHPRTHVRMCSNTLCAKAPHPRTAKGVSKLGLLRPHKHKLSAGNYEIQLTPTSSPSTPTIIRQYYQRLAATPSLRRRRRTLSYFSALR